MKQTEALASLFERYAIDHKPDGWPAIRQIELSNAAAELRRLDAVNARLVEFAREYLSNWGDLEGYLQDMARAAIAATGDAP